MYIWQKRYGRTDGQTYTLSYTDGFRESLSPDFQIADVTFCPFFFAKMISKMTCRRKTGSKWVSVRPETPIKKFQLLYDSTMK